MMSTCGPRLTVRTASISPCARRPSEWRSASSLTLRLWAGLLALLSLSGCANIHMAQHDAPIVSNHYLTYDDAGGGGEAALRRTSSKADSICAGKGLLAISKKGTELDPTRYMLEFDCSRTEASSPDQTALAGKASVAQVDRSQPDPFSSQIVWRRGYAGASIGPAQTGFSNANPLDGIGNLADARMEAWLKSGLPIFTGSPPQKPSAPPLPTLTKDEFEQTAVFQSRVAKAEQDRAETIRALSRDYERQVHDYNDAIAAHNEALRNEIERRQRELSVMRFRFLSEAIAERLGQPELQNLKYDADTETFFARLTSSRARFDRLISLRVPLAVAPTVKASAAAAIPTVIFKLDGGQISISQIKITVADATYEAAMGDAAAPVAMVATVRDAPMVIPELLKATPHQADVDGLIDENRRHFATIINGIGTDPAMEALRQREAEAARRLREAESQRAVEAERDRLLVSIRSQEDRLQQLQAPGVSGPDAKGLVPFKLWSFRPASVPSRELIAVIIGNRNYAAGIAKVSYAHNDAKAMRQFVETALGVPKENIIFELDATKGTMEGIFQSRLPNLVEKGRTDVLVYYSGHGMPVGDDARLMPVDSRPDTAKVTGYSRQDLLEQLGRLGARDVTVILDACFTGSSAAGPLLASAKPILLRPVRDAALPSNGLLITASRGDEVSWVDDTTGMSLLTLHLLEGLSGGADTAKTGRIDATAINAYLSETVDRHARRDWNQPQHPQVMGSNRTIVQY